MALASLLGHPPIFLKVKHLRPCWIAGLLQGLIQSTADKDTILSRWLLEGAPAGFALPIPPGPYFPPASDPEGAAIEDMLAAEKNHPSFYACYGEKVSPGLKQALKEVERGFA